MPDRSLPPQTEPAAPRRARAALRWVGFIAWLVGTTVVISSLMAGHLLPLPTLTHAPSAMSPGPRWRAIHVLAADCPCSRAVLDHLLRRGPAQGVDEKVYVAGLPGDTRGLAVQLVARGFAVSEVSAWELLDALSVRGAPWLLWVDPDGRTRYSGGYATLRPRPGVELEDLAILRRLQAHEAVSPHPAFGCAIDPVLRRALDPLSLTSR